MSNSLHSTQAKTILDSETIPKVELDFMNNVHFEEVEMVKHLGALITDYQINKKNPDKISYALNTWLDHTKAHFSRENELMQETAFPAYGVHSQEHEVALNRMQTVLSEWLQRQDIDFLSAFVFSHWPEWFNAHVSSMDMMTAKFAVINGYTES